MTKQELQKIVATALATGSLVSAAAYGVAKPDCDFVVFDKEKEICVTEELKEAIESQLRPNAGFGGVKFGDK